MYHLRQEPLMDVDAVADAHMCIPGGTYVPQKSGTEKKVRSGKKISKYYCLLESRVSCPGMIS